MLLDASWACMRGQRDRRAQGDDVGDRRVLGQLRLDRLLHRRQVGPVDLQVLRVREALTSRPAQRVSSATEPCAWMMHRVLPPGSSAVRLLPTVCPASSSSEPKYILAPASLYWSMPWLNATTGMPASAAFFDHRDHRVRAGQRHGDAGDLAVDRVLHQRGLLGAVLVVRVLQGDPVRLGRVLRAGPDLVPERVTRLLVGDHLNGQVGAGRCRRRRCRLRAPGSARRPDCCRPRARPRRLPRRPARGAFSANGRSSSIFPLSRQPTRRRTAVSCGVVLLWCGGIGRAGPEAAVRAHPAVPGGVSTNTLRAIRTSCRRSIRDRHCPCQFDVGKWKLEPLAPSTCGQRDVTTFARV